MKVSVGSCVSTAGNAHKTQDNITILSGFIDDIQTLNVAFHLPLLPVWAQLNTANISYGC